MLMGRTYLTCDRREMPGARAGNVYRIHNQQPRPPSAHNPRLPAWLDGEDERVSRRRPAGQRAL